MFKHLFSKTMLGSYIGAALFVVTHGPTVQGITGAIAIVLTAAGVRDAIAKNGNGS